MEFESDKDSGEIKNTACSGIFEVADDSGATSDWQIAVIQNPETGSMNVHLIAVDPVAGKMLDVIAKIQMFNDSGKTMKYLKYSFDLDHKIRTFPKTDLKNEKVLEIFVEVIGI